VWAGVSAAFAILFIHLHFAVRRDHERTIPRLKFTVILWIGVIGFLAGIIGLITYIVLGTSHHENGVDPKGYYVVCFWTPKTLAWGFSTFMAARAFRKSYYDEELGLVQNA